jgi:hypothetical protein
MGRLWGPLGVLALYALAPGSAPAQQDPAQVIAQTSPDPAIIADGIAPVTPANTRRNRFQGTIDVFLVPEPGRDALPVIDPERDSPEAGVLRRLVASGKAAGLADVIYDNRDQEHSSLQPGLFPQVSRTRYDDVFKREYLHHGVAGRMMFSLPTVGNSSTALTQGPIARSNARIALADQVSAMRTFRLYASNHMYVYPEHRDYDADLGDRLYSSAPYFMVSQGSSYRDQPFVEALLTVLAAFRPDTRAKLVELGLLAPTAQMVLRRTLDRVRGVSDYLSPIAHPVVFENLQLRLAAAVAYANSITPETIPPMVKLTVLSDFPSVPGQDYLAVNLSESLFTTPSAVARLWRSFAYSRSMAISAAATEDPNGRPLRYHWVLLQGDPARVRILPQGESGETARIEMDWHDPFPARPQLDLQSARVDIGVFADNGVHISAPATVSVLFPTHQAREYRAAAGGQMRLHAIDYTEGPESVPRRDAVIWPEAPWRDTLEWGEDSRVAVIERSFHGTGQVQKLRRVANGWTRGGGADSSAIRHEARRVPPGVLALDAGDGEPPQDAPGDGQ